MPFGDTIRPLAASRTLAYVFLMASATGVYAILAVWKENSAWNEVGDMPSGMHAALSVVLGWLLVFRTNTSYARWWEARTLWGSLVNTCRNLAIKCLELGHPNAHDRELLARSLVAFPKQLRDHLRGIPSFALTEKDLSESDVRNFHGPMATTHSLYRWLSGSIRDGKLRDCEMRSIENDLVKLMDICGACERIARTPFIRSYRTFVRQCIVVILLTFPWGIANDFGWWTIPITVLTAYFMIGMEVVAEHVEEPFGLDEDDLDLDGLCNTIERSVESVLGPSKHSQSE